MGKGGGPGRKPGQGLGIWEVAAEGAERRSLSVRHGISMQLESNQRQGPAPPKLLQRGGKKLARPANTTPSFSLPATAN